MATVRKITSRQNDKIKETVGICRSPRESAFFIEGTKFVSDLPKDCIVSLFTTDAEKFSDLISALPDIPVYEVTKPVMEKLCGAVSDQELCAVIKKPSVPMPSKLVLLDGVRDPGNAGTVIRTAAAFGFGCVFSSDSADPFAGKTVRSTAGALINCFVTRCELPEKIKELKELGYYIISSELDETAKKLGDFGIPEKVAIIVGNEGRGVSRECSALADTKLYIPIKNTNSLNAAIAAAIMMHTFSEVV